MIPNQKKNVLIKNGAFWAVVLAVLGLCLGAASIGRCAKQLEAEWGLPMGNICTTLFIVLSLVTIAVVSTKSKRKGGE